MNYTEHKFTLDVSKTASQVSIKAKKGDIGRRLVITLMNNGYPYHITEDCYAVIAATKPDGYIIFNNCVIDNCVITYDFTAQTVAAAGIVNCEIILYGKRAMQLTSASFDIIVEDSNFSSVESSSEANAFAALLLEVKALNALGLRAPAIVCEADGENIRLSNASNDALQGLRIFGKSIQAAEPTLDNPVELEGLDAPVISVSNGTEEDVQTIAFPDSLLGVPMSRMGVHPATYTDSDGKCWVGDEVDLKRGVYVQRIGTITSADMLQGFVALNQESDKYNQYTVNSVLGPIVPEVIDSLSTSSPYKALCNCLPLGGQVNAGTKKDAFWIYSLNVIVLVLNKTDFPNAKSVETWLANNDVEIQYILKEPIEIALTPEEKAVFAQMHTYKPVTTIYNDAGAYMVANYVADTKTYVDRSSGSGSAVSIGKVDLLAANWIGDETPYSQVVALAGVTEYSMVTLNPSVEQLAIFHDKDLAFVTENDDGIVTVYAIGDKPENDYTIQVSITEVNV